MEWRRENLPAPVAAQLTIRIRPCCTGARCGWCGSAEATATKKPRWRDEHHRGGGNLNSPIGKGIHARRGVRTAYHPFPQCQAIFGLSKTRISSCSVPELDMPA